MAIIHALHHQTEKLLGELSNTGATDKYFRLCEISQDLNGELISNFWMPATIEESIYFEERALYLLTDEDGKYMEFIIFQSETDGDEKQVFGVASYTDMNKKKIINPEVFTNKNLVEYAEIIFPGTLWQMGVNETTGFKSVTLESHEGAYSFMLRVAQAFDVEMKFRIETSGSRVIGRYVDFVERVGRDTQKEIEFGKDLIGVRKIVHSERIVSALLCVGPQKEDGTRLTSLVTDEDAFQRWNVGGQHIIDIYEPESSQTEMTLTQLNQYGRTELNKRISSVIEYIVDAEVIEGKEPHEKTRLGDRIRVKNPEFTPPLYADARVISSTRMLDEEDKKTYNIGEVVTYTEDEIFKVFRTLQDIYGTRVVKGPTAPAGSFNVIWIKTGGLTDVAYTWDGEAWNKIAPTTAIEIGAATPEDVAEKIDAIEIGARNIVVRAEEIKDKYISLSGVITNATGFSIMKDYIQVMPGDTLTFTKNDETNHWRWSWHDQDMIYISRAAEILNEFQWVVPANTYLIRVSYSTADKVKIERGTKKTDWTPSPEDVEFMAQTKADAAEESAKVFATTEIEAATVANEEFVQDYAQSRISQNVNPPEFPKIDDLWIDISSGSPVWKRWDGNAWTLAAKTTLAELGGVLDAAQIAVGGIAATHIANGAITEVKISNGAITDTKLADLAVTAAKLAANSVTGDKIIDDAISSAKIALNAITETKIANSAITNTKLAALAVDAAKLAAGAVTSTKIGDGAVTTAKILDDAISAAKIAAGAVTELKIGNGAITTTKLADLAVDAAKLKDSAVTSTKIANLAVGTAAIANAAITNAKINDLDAAKITAGTISADRIGANTITAAKMVAGTITALSGIIADAAITSAKIAALAVGTAAIQDLAVTSAKVVALDAAKITTGTLDANRIAANSITAAKIAGLTITAAQLAADSIIADKIATGAVTADAIAANSITSNMIVTAGLDAQVIKFGTMSGDRIAANSIKADRLVAGSITGEMINGGTIDGVTIRSGFGTAKTITLTAGAATFVETFTSGSNTIVNTTRMNDNGVTLESEENGISWGGASINKDGFVTNSFQTVEATMINPGEIKMNYGLSHFLSVAPNYLNLGGSTTLSYVESRKALELGGNGQVLKIDTDTLLYNGNPIGLTSLDPLWSGVQYVHETYTVTPSKKLSECPNGWLLVWSRFTGGAAVNSDWNTTVIHRRMPNATANTGGTSVSPTATSGIWCPLPAAGANDVDQPPIAHKLIYVTDSTIKGHRRNAIGTQSGQVLRYVYPF